MEQKMKFILPLLFSASLLTACHELGGQGASLVDRIKSMLGFSSKVVQPQPVLEKATQTPNMPNVPQSTQITPDQAQKEFAAFEEALFAEEDEAIAKVEDEIAGKVGKLMSDPRVVALLKETPDVSYEELPAEIYDAIMALSASEELRINEIMDATDAKLKAKAESLGIKEEDVMQEDRQAEKEKRIMDVKAKSENKA